MKFTIYLERCSHPMLLGDGTLVFGWVEEIPGAYVYGRDQLQVQREAEAQVLATLDWRIEHGETHWNGMVQDARCGTEIEFKQFVRPTALVGPQHKQDPFQLGTEDYPLKRIDIPRLITLCSYALSDLDRIGAGVSEEEWLMPLCDGRVTASVFGELFSELMLVAHVWRIMQSLGMKPKEAHFSSGYTHLMQTYRETHGIDAEGNGYGERLRWTWRHDALRLVMEDCLSALSDVQELPGVVVSMEIWTLRKILLIWQWLIRLTAEKLMYRSKSGDVVNPPVSLHHYMANLDYIGLQKPEYSYFWVATVTFLMRSVGDAADRNLDRLCNLLLGYFTNPAAEDDTIPKRIQQEIVSLRGTDYYRQEDELSLKYQCLASICWQKVKIESDLPHFIEGIYVALDRIAQIHGDEQAVISLLRAKIAENAERWPDSRWRIM